MELFEAIHGRRSIRKYKKEPLAKEVMEKIVEAGRWAASARGEYPWRFVVITEPGRLKELAGIVGNNGRFIADAGAAIIVTTTDSKYYIEDGCAAAQNILLAAYGLGVGTCWVAGDKKDYAEAVLRFAGSNPKNKLICIISCGIPDEKPAKEKPPLAEVMFWEKIVQ
ncbi:MAG: nitroreductase family protein [Spirochaetia bacterium]|nr:nitroreductase family protein [Spirochaetia bacterium]